MKKLLTGSFALLMSVLIFSFTVKSNDEKLQLNLDPSRIVWTSDGDIEESVIHCNRIFDQGRLAPVGVEFCPGRGEVCNVIYFDGAGNPVVLSAKKTVGGPAVTVTLD